MRIFSTALMTLLLGLSGCSTAEMTPYGDREDLPRWMQDIEFAPAQDPEELAEKREAERERIQSARNQNDLVLGMGMEDVSASWGEPIEVNQAGDDSRGNQRWAYPQGVSQGSAPVRVVYFENGRVVGWETQDRD